MPSLVASSFHVVHRVYGQSTPSFSRNRSIPSGVRRPNSLGATVSTLIGAPFTALANGAKSFYNPTISASPVRPILCSLAIVGGLVLLGASALAAGAGAAEGGAFTATAAADGTRVTVTIRNAPLTDSPVDGGGPSAQSRLDSSG